MSIPAKKYDSDIPEGHAMQEKRNWHQGDQVLRRNGFKIHARPPGKEAQWRLGTEIYTEAEAHHFVQDTMHKALGV